MRREGRSARWPALLLLAGAAGLLRSPALEHLSARVEELLLSAARCLDPRAWRRPDPPEAQVEAAVDPRVLEFLASARQGVLPSPRSGWRRDGDFHVVALGEPRSSGALPLAGPGALPPGEPVFLGETLVGFTAPDADVKPRVLPLLARGTRLPAHTRSRDGREARFLAIGDGSDTLRVSFADASEQLTTGASVQAGDSAASMADAASVVRGALLGTLERASGSAGADRVEWRVRPAFSLATLAEVAIRFPPGFPGPSDLALVPLCVRVIPWHGSEPRRRAFVVPAGAELGVTAGSAVAAGPFLIGRVARAGWQRALVRGLDDPGFRVRALVLDGARVLPWTFTVAAGDAEELACLDAPPADAAAGALVVTAASPDGTPEGLLLGVLAGDERVARVRRTFATPTAVTLFRPRGPWSDEP